MDDESYMQFAFDLASRMKGQTSPNPAVGAVVVFNHEIVGFGAHVKAGDDHAEVHALNMASEKAKGATLYVTLEPCNHEGKTGPCTKRIIESGIKRVVIASIDPHEKVAGQGIRHLQAAGIDTEVGMLELKAKEINKEFFHYITAKKPFVTMKVAQSLDGKIATFTGDSRWITGNEARRDVHQYRHQYDAILVGVNTVITDNPRLTTRLPHGGKNPVRIILDHHLRTPLDSHVITDDKAETWIFVGNKVSEDKIKRFTLNNKVLVFQMNSSSIKVIDVLSTLGEKGIMSVFVEGGATVHGSFLDSGYINQVITYVSPKLIGGNDARTAIGGNGIEKLKDVLPLKILEVKQLGDDIKIIADVIKEDKDVYRNC